MRVAALYDIHGNLPALDAVLDEVRRVHVDQIVVGGDVIPGPMVRETLDRLRTLDVPVHYIYGNGEVAVLAQRAGTKPNVPELYQPMIRWTADRLRDEDERALRAWPMVVRLDVPGMGRVLFCHATPRNENELFTNRTPEAPLLPIFSGLGVDVVVCGHTHMPFDRMIGTTRVVNAGSIGMPFGPPGADWLLLGPDVELRHTAYDLPAAAAQIHAIGFPPPPDFAAQVTNPPSAEEMLAAYVKAEIH